MKQLSQTELKILLVGFLGGVILTLLILKMMNVPFLIDKQLSSEADEFILELDDGSDLISTESAEMDQF